MKPSVSKRRSSYKIYNAINKYGSENFYVETLDDNIPIDELDQKEIEYIKKYNSYENGYNSTPGGDGRVINILNNEEEVLKLANDGISAQELAERFGVHRATISRTLHKLGFYFYESHEQEILELSSQGKTNKEIASLLGIHEETVSRCLKNNGKRKHRLPLYKRDNFDYESLFHDYENQVPIDDILVKYDISKTTLARVRKQFGIEARKQIYHKKGEETSCVKAVELS